MCSNTLVTVLKQNIAKEATVYTDEAGQYAAEGVSSPHRW